MKIARGLLAGIAGLLAGALLAIWLLPPQLDWNRYRGSFEQLASAALGRPVSIAGPISLSLLPKPVLQAGQVSVGERDGRTAGSFSVKTMRLEVALGPLLAGRVDARELVLRQPALRLPWPLPPEVLQPHPATWVSSLSARVEDGAVTVGTMAVTDINGSVRIGETDALALSAAGTATLLGQTWRFGTRLARQGPHGALGLDLALDGASGLGGTFSGQLTPDGTLAGELKAGGPDLSQLMPAPAVPFKAQGRLTAASGLAAADDLLLDIGGSPAHGSVALRVGPAERLDVALAASRIDLDAWLPVLSRGGGSRIPFGLDISAEAARLRGGTLRRLRASFELTPGTLRMNDFSAILPGEAALLLTGSSPPGAGAPGASTADSDKPAPLFAGEATIDAPDLRTTLAWLGSAGVSLPAAFPPSVLHDAALSAHVLAYPDALDLAGLHGHIDGTKLAGDVAFHGAKPASVSADLTADLVDLDPWLPRELPARADLAGWPAAADATLHLRAGQVFAGGLTVGEAALNATTRAGRVDLQQLGFTVLGARVEAAGSVDPDGQVSDGKLTFATADATPLAAVLPQSWRATPALWHGPAALEMTASGGPAALGLRIGLDIADARLEAQPTVDLDSGRWNGPVTLRHPGARRLITTAGLLHPLGDPDLGRWLGDGSLSLVAQVTGAPGRLSADNFDLTAGALRAGGQLVLDTTDVEPRLTGRVVAENLTVPLPDLGSTDPLPVAALRGWQASVHVEAATLLGDLMPIADHLAADVAVGKGALRIEHLTARAGSGVIMASTALDGAATPPTLAVKASLTGWDCGAPLFGTPVDLASGRVQADLDVTAAAYSPSALRASAEGQVHGTVTDGVLTGVDLPAIEAAIARANTEGASDLEAAVRVGLAGGVTPFSRLDLAADLSGGELQLRNARLTAPSGSIAGTGTVSIVAATEDIRLGLQPPEPDAPELGLRLLGPVGSPRRSQELEGLVRWLVAHL